MLLQVCLLSPAVCRVDRHPGTVDTSVLPAHCHTHHPHPSSPVFPLYKLGEVKTRAKEILEDVGREVALTDFVKAYEGFYGSMTTIELRCDNWLGVVRMMPDVCRLRKQQGKYLVSANSGTEDCHTLNATPEDSSRQQKRPVAAVSHDFIINLHRVLRQCPGGVPYSHLYRKYLEITGGSLVVTQHGHNSLTSLLRSIHGRHGFIFDGSKVTSDTEMTLLPKLKPEDVASGWVRIVDIERVDRCRVLRADWDSWELELQMEEHYVTRARGRRLPEEEAVLGQAVAALYTDTRVYRLDNITSHVRII